GDFRVHKRREALRFEHEHAGETARFIAHLPFESALLLLARPRPLLQRPEGLLFGKEREVGQGGSPTKMRSSWPSACATSHWPRAATGPWRWDRCDAYAAAPCQGVGSDP